MLPRALIFDLDTCLAPADEPGRALYAPAFAAIREANAETLDDDALGRAFDACWRFPFDDVAQRFGFSSAMIEAGRHAFAGIEVTTPMRGYGDLPVLEALPRPRFLVTTGFQSLQESKVRALGIASSFDEVIVDAIDRRGDREPGKEPIFREILARHRLDPGAVVVIGDNPRSEIAAGNRLGCPTVQMLRPGVEPSAAATHLVSDLHELRTLLDAMAAADRRPEPRG